MRLLAAAAISVLTLNASALRGVQRPTFSEHVESVRVDALVTDNGHPVSGLSAADFEITDNGVTQRVEHASVEDGSISVIFAFDASRSVSGAALEQLRSASNAVLDRLRPGDQSALVTFSHVVSVKSRLTLDLLAVRAQLGRIDSEGGTSLNDGVSSAMALARPEDGRTLLLIFSDGIDTSSWLEDTQVVDAARRSNVVVYAVSTVPNRRDSLLPDLARSSGGQVATISSQAELARSFLSVIDEFRQRYMVGYSPKGVPQDGFHRIAVRVRGKRVKITARAGYFARP